MNEPKTPNLGLNKIDRSSPSTTNFDLDKYLDQNWEKIDEGLATKQELEELRSAVEEIDIPDASLTQKGKVQLSNNTSGMSETLAVTEKAVSNLRKTVETRMGNLADLQTRDKDNLVDAFNEVFTSVINGKRSVKNAIIDKGGKVLDGDGTGVPTFLELVEGVKSTKLKYDFGNGKDGAFNSTKSITLPVGNADLDTVIKEYTTFKLNAEHVFSVSSRCRGLIIKATESIVIDGEINMDGKSAQHTNEAIRISYFDLQSVKEGGIFIGMNTDVNIILPPGGRGGNGSASTGDSTTLGGTGSIGYWFGGGSGGGAAGAKNRYTGATGNKGGSGGNAVDFTSVVGASGGNGATNSVDGSPGSYGSGGGGGKESDGRQGQTGGSSLTGKGAGGGCSGGYNGQTSYRGNINGKGWGGGMIVLFAPKITINSGARISARGADGGEGGSGDHNTTPGGGGGGNGGGVICIIGEIINNNGTCDVSGGAGGAGGTSGSYGTAASGSPGTIGTVYMKEIIN